MIRRAQIEMMGLVVIVILVTIGLFFSLALRKPSPTQGLIDVYGNEAFANNFLITLLETQITPGPSCGTYAKPLTMYDLAVDCVRVSQGIGGEYSCESKDSCTFFNDTTETILDLTINEWELFTYNLTFIYSFDGNDMLAQFGTGCNKYQQQTAPGMQTISLYRITMGTAYMRFRTCSLNG